MTARTSPIERGLGASTCIVCNARCPAHMALVPIGPGPDATERMRARRGDPYTPFTIPICRACAFGDELEDETDRSTRGGEPPRTVPREPMK